MKTPQNEKRDSLKDSSLSIQNDFDNIVLKNEIFRAKLILFICLLFFVLIIPAAFLFPNDIEQTFQGKDNLIATCLFTFGGVLYEIGIWYLLKNVLPKRKKLLKTVIYLNAIEEITIPTIFLLMIMQIADPLYAILSSPEYYYFLFIALCGFRLDFFLSVLIGLLAAIQYFLFAQYAIAHTQIIDIHPLLISQVTYIDKSAVLFICGVLTGLVTFQLKRQILRSITHLEEKNRIANIFGQHVSPKVVDKLLEQKTELSSETKNVCVMFLDIRNFTTFSENRSPEEVVTFLNTLFDFMIEIINKHNGIINKFLGDGFMAIFGAPFSDGEDVNNAMNASKEIIQTLDEKISKNELPQTRIGIGLHSGKAVTGNIGSLLRKEYTVIGDVVNLASRIESLNKQFHSQLLISESVFEGLKEKKYIEFLGPAQVKGHEKPIPLYRVI